MTNSVLYIGQYSEGTTSKMRADQIKALILPQMFDVIDTNIPFFRTQRIFQSVGFRYKIGPLVWNINTFVRDNIKEIDYDLIWVDKGVFINQQTIQKLRQLTPKLVHFTPDMAFFANKSHLFEKTISNYDFLVTTKIRERDAYLERINREKLIITTQGFDINIHKNIGDFSCRRNAVSFIGFNERYRESIIQTLIDNRIEVLLAGKKWLRFVNKNKNNKYLKFYGNGLFSSEYSKFIGSTKMSLGLLSKNFPELHTTRTFEIPACGTILLTERNEELKLFFNEDEVIFYDDKEDLVNKIKFYFKNYALMVKIAKKGHNKVHTSGYDYESILTNILQKIL